MTYRKPKLRINANKVSRAISGTAKLIADQHTDVNKATHRKIKVMSAQQNINFLLANCSFLNRRTRSGNKAHARFAATGKEDGWIRTAYEYLADCLIVTVEFYWNVIKAILIFFATLILRVVLIIFFTFIVFYILYLFITS